MTLLTALSLLSACVVTESSPPTVTRPVGVGGEVVWVTDGDTIDVATGDGEVTVRLVATNAPDRDECFYEEALAHLIDSVKGTTVRLETFGLDQFDRLLAHVFAEERHVNLEMVSTGLVLATTPEADDPYRAVMIDAEQEAYEQGLGLWGESACGSAGPAGGIEIDTRGSVVDPADPDDDRLADETIRLVNSGDEVVDLTGWTIRDESSRHRFHFAEHMALAAGDGIDVSSADPGWSPGGEPVWNNDGDLVLVLDAAGNVMSRWRY